MTDKEREELISKHHELGKIVRLIKTAGNFGKMDKLINEAIIHYHDFLGTKIEREIR